MPRFFFDILDGILTTDDTGTVFPNAHVARDAAIKVLPDVVRGDEEIDTGETDTSAEIGQVARAYGAFARKVPLLGGDYTIEHTLTIYLMDSQGRFVGPLDLAVSHKFVI